MSKLKRTVSAQVMAIAFSLGALCNCAVADTNRIIDNVKREGADDYREAVEAFLKPAPPKIVGGQLAPDHAYPWQVSLEVSWIADPKVGHFCGGSIYSDRWIVTAAHCVEKNRPENVIVTASTNRLDGSGQRRNIKRIVLRADYNRWTKDNDIALLEMFTPLKLDKITSSIELVTPELASRLLIKDADVTVTGWGFTRENGTVVRDLRYVDVKMVDRDFCNAPLSYNGLITDNMICAGVDAGGKDSCQGDSGGPLVVYDGNTPRLAGIVSWGRGCAKPRKFGVYTRVTNYTKWIDDCIARPDNCQ